MSLNITHGRIEDELVHRLMHQRIIVLGEALEEGDGNRLMHQLLLLPAEDPRADISLGSTPRVGRSRRCSLFTT